MAVPTGSFWALLKMGGNALTALLTHLSVFYFDLDPIKDLRPEHSVAEIPRLYATSPQSQLKNFGSKIGVLNVHYLIPLLCALAIDLDSAFLVVFGYGGRYNASGMPELFTHRIGPQAYWELSDVIYNTGIAIQMVTFFTLLRRPQVPSGKLMWAVPSRKTEVTRIFCGGKFWHQQDSEQLLRFRRRTRTAFSALMVVLFCQVTGYFMAQHLLKGDDLLTPRNIIFTLFMPFFGFYCSYADASIVFYFFLVARYFRIRQQITLKRLACLLRKVEVLQNRKDDQMMMMTPTVAWRHFAAFNEEVLALYQDLKVYSSFWRPLLTNYFGGYIVLICFMSYAFLFGGSDDWRQNSFYVFFSVEFLLILLAITAECSKIVQQFVRLHNFSVRFAYRYSRAVSTSSGSSMISGSRVQGHGQQMLLLPQHFLPQLLQLSKLISNHRGTRTGFCLMNNSVIDSKMFEYLFFSLSILFMKIFKNKNYKEAFVG